MRWRWRWGSLAWKALRAHAACADIDDELQIQVLDQATKFVTNIVAPASRDGDNIGCRFVAGEVITPSGFRRTCAGFQQGRWPALSVAIEDGGQALPGLIEAIVAE